jgi:hypothetical protein
MAELDAKLEQAKQQQPELYAQAKREHAENFVKNHERIIAGDDLLTPANLLRRNDNTATTKEDREKRLQELKRRAAHETGMTEAQVEAFGKMAEAIALGAAEGEIDPDNLSKADAS